MAEKLRAAIIGCGRRMKSPGATGCGMGREHVPGYLDSPRAELVAYCDTNRESAQMYRDEHGPADARVYTDFQEMLRTEKPDMVSIALWPHLHAPVVIACADSGSSVRAIHCEKPMALTWGDAKKMAAVCEARGVQLTFNHQRRFGAPFRRAKEMIAAGEIGDLLRLEASCDNLYDWGTHWFDMLFFLNDETPVEWVIGQIEPRGSRKVFGAPVERQGVSHWKFANGVRGLLITGYEAKMGAQIRATGTRGVIELGAATDEGEVRLRVLGKSADGWQTVPFDPPGDTLHGPNFIGRAIEDAMEALVTGREPELSARRALQATELIFATWESSRRRGRVSLPLDVDDSALQALIDDLPVSGE